MSSVDAQIDELYKAPLQEFVQLRAALAKTLSGEEARRVKALAKPTLVPWAVNQLYWRARAVYDRLTASGARLRSVQIAGLEGRPADVHRAAETHRQALTDAINQATSLASRAGARPDLDALTQTLEALSLSSNLGEPGRLTKPLQPAGFEALAGVAVRTPPPAIAQASRASAGKRPPSSGPTAEERRRTRLRAAAERRHAAALRDAEENLKKAQAAEVRTRHAWERAREEVEKAERALAAQQAGPSDD
ncbi:MAG TPA: hypothetical protein VH702_08050 [Vicinamibacterales bacterium]